MKHYLIGYDTIDGEHEYCDKFLMSIEPDENIKEVVHKYFMEDHWGKADDEGDGRYYYPDSGTGVKHVSITELPEADYNVLKKYIIGD
jgi:hypothetical protein